MANWEVSLPSDANEVGNPGHTEDHNTIVKAIAEARANVDQIDAAVAGAAKTAEYGQITGKPATFPPTIGSTAATAMAGNTQIPTVPGALTAAEAEAGSSTAARTISARVLADEIDRRVAAAIAAIQPAG